MINLFILLLACSSPKDFYVDTGLNGTNQEIDSDEESLYQGGCWVIAGPHADNYCFYPTELWPEPGFEASCESQSYLAYSTETCPEESATGYCILNSNAGGDYLGAAVGIYYHNDIDMQESGCLQANGIYHQ